MAQMRHLFGLGFLTWALIMPCRAQAAETPRVVVVSSQQKGGPKIQQQVAKYVERALKKSTTLVPFGSYYSAARAAGFKGNAIFGAEAAIPGGRGVGATHVLFVTSTLEGGGHRGHATAVAVANLIVVSTGEALFTHRYTLAGRRLTASQGALIVAAVNERLAPATVPSPALAVPVAPQFNPSPAPAPPILAPADNRLPADIGQNAPPADGLASGPPASGPASTPQNAPSALAGNPPGAAASDPTAVVFTPPSPTTARLDCWRPGFSAALGALIYWRSATVDAGPNTNPPCYCTPAGSPQPTFSRFALRAELYPLAFTGTGRWWEGFGLHVDTSLGAPQTRIDDGTVTSQASGQLLADVQYRLVLFNDKTAPELIFGVGYSTYSFPLSGAVFPGLGFRSESVSLATVVPLGTEVIALVARADLMPHLVGFGGNSALGTQAGNGLGMHVEGGLRGRLFGWVDLQALFMLDRYTLGYTGSTRLANTATQLSHVSVIDRLLGVYLLAGVTL